MAKRRKHQTNLDVYTGSDGYQEQDYYTSKSLTHSTTQINRVRVEEDQGEKLISISKKGKWLIFGILLSILAIAGIGYFFYLQVLGTTDLITNGDTIVKELGEEIVLSRDMFINETAMNGFVKDKIVLDTSLTVDSKYEYDENTKVVKTKGKGYLDVGEYPVRIHLGSQEKVVVLKVQDTIAPKITGLSDILRVEQNAQNLKIEDFFAVSDFSEYNIDISGKYNLKKAGKYDIEIVVKDDNGNETSAKTTLDVITAKEVASTKGTTLAQTIDGATPVSEATENQIVAGKLVGVVKPIGYNGNSIEKGKYSNPDTQKRKEAEKKAKEKAKKEAEAEAKRQQQQANTPTNNYNSTSQTPTNNNNNQYQQSQQPQPVVKPTGPKPVGDYVDENGVRHTDLFTTMEGAEALLDWYVANGYSARLAGAYDRKTGETLTSADGRIMLYKVYLN